MKINKKTKTKLAIYIALVLTFNFGFTPVFAAGDPISVVNNLSDFKKSHTMHNARCGF